jgi:hypothetical protein
MSLVWRRLIWQNYLLVTETLMHADVATPGHDTYRGAAHHPHNHDNKESETSVTVSEILSTVVNLSSRVVDLVESRLTCVATLRGTGGHGASKMSTSIAGGTHLSSSAKRLHVSSSAVNTGGFGSSIASDTISIIAESRSGQESVVRVWADDVSVDLS